ncbi:tight junction protein ZO-3 isoform X2 [Eublepharis macularius]|uniref:Tight junction protein ZO-3 isoform X2 n=1 Tax=Eublepharis macularius TaxID=481883 RepID=A0AA97JER5_EUBMA|nr:tight junction protein ZO-3 isoform X2 [Eublepharis macularius]
MPVPVPEHAAETGLLRSDMAVRFQVAEMEEMVIWEQYTVTLNKDPRKGFGIAISGGRDRPNNIDGDTSIIISDVVPGGPADGRLLNRDKIAMVNGLSMENVSSSFAIQTLKSCSKVANVTVKRPRKIHLPVTSQSKSQPSGSASRSANTGHYDSDEEYTYQTGASRHPSYGQRQAEADHNRGYDGDSSSERSSGRYRDEDDAPLRQPIRSRRRSQDGSHRRQSQDSDSDRQPFTNGYSYRGNTSGLALVSGFKRLPRQDVPMKPVRSTLVKSKESEEYGLKLGSQIFIKHITHTGLAAKDASLQEGDLILKINGVASENMSLAETRQLIEKSEGRLTLLVLRDNSQFLVNIPQVRDSDSESSQLDDISDLGSDTSMPSPVGSPQQPPDSLQRNSFLSKKRSSREVVVPVEELTVAPVADPQETLVNNDACSATLPSQGNLEGYSPDSKMVRFVKAKNIGLRLAGGNDVGIFVAGVQEGSPAEIQGIVEGDQILQVNDRIFHNLTREEAVQYLLELIPGEEVALHVQNKQDIYRKMMTSNVGDSFYIRTHFDFEKDTPSGMSFIRGEVFHVLDTMYRGKMGSWLAMRMGKELQELDKGIIPNKSRAEQIASLESVLKSTPSAFSSSGARAEFWKLRGLRGGKKNLRKSREDLSALTKQGHYPPYERVVLKEATFKRPVVILGPIADIAMQKLSAEMPDQFEIAESVPREGGSAKVIKLDSVRQIAEQEKHALLDITPAAVERLNYVQYFPIVVFCKPDSRQGVKAMRQWLAPDSKKSSRRLYAQATKMHKHWSHIFTATISLAGSSNSWYESLKDVIRMQQARPIWTTEEQVDYPAEEGFDMLSQPPTGNSGYLTCDSQANSDYEETDAEGEAYTDQELDEPYQEPALARSSEPAKQSPEMDLNERVAAALAYPIDRHDGNQQPQGQWRQDYDIREYEHEALRKKFTQAQAYDSESDQDYGYDWGPATDL